MGCPELSDNGFFFMANSEQLDLSQEEYGTTVIAPTFVRGKISKLADAELLLFHESGWDGYQDIYVVQKIAAMAG
jgi:hypothetical protein